MDRFGENYRYPVHIDEDTWFYISKSGKTIEFVRQVKNNKGELVQCDMFHVRVNKIDKAVNKVKRDARKSSNKSR